VAIVCIVFMSIFAGFIAGLNLAWTALADAVLVMVLTRRDTHEVLKLVDSHLLIFFAALFVVVDGLTDTGLPDAIYHHLQPIFGTIVSTQAWNLTWFSAAGSNVFSNVPFVLVAGKWIGRFAVLELMWKVLALATTFCEDTGRLSARSRTLSWSNLRAGLSRSVSGTTRVLEFQ
jgi:Na+/H+ antiporter NhaD/arsenite permease-like protein